MGVKSGVGVGSGVGSGAPPFDIVSWVREAEQPSVRPSFEQDQLYSVVQDPPSFTFRVTSAEGCAPQTQSPGSVPQRLLAQIVIPQIFPLIVHPDPICWHCCDSASLNSEDSDSPGFSVPTA